MENKLPILLLVNKDSIILNTILNKIKEELATINYFVIDKTSDFKNIEHLILNLKKNYKEILIINLLLLDTNDDNTLIYTNYSKHNLFYKHFIKFLNLKVIYNGNDGIVKTLTKNVHLKKIFNKINNISYAEFQFNKTIFGLEHHPENINSYKQERLTATLLGSLINFINVLVDNLPKE